MEQEQERNRPTVYLQCKGLNHWSITNKNGIEIIQSQRFHSKRDAIEWARAMISSWPNWNLVIKDEE